jgi:hypothetical protein
MYDRHGEIPLEVFAANHGTKAIGRSGQKLDHRGHRLALVAAGVVTLAKNPYPAARVEKAAPRLPTGATLTESFIRV